MRYYLYCSHMGTYYIMDHELSVEEEYCETCGDFDELVGTFKTADQLRKILKDNNTWEPCIEDLVNTWKEICDEEEI